jgi:hypothetical protein
MTRALYDAYNGQLYQVMRASDKTTADIGVLAAGGFANAAAQDAFCAGTDCVVQRIYDQVSARGDAQRTRHEAYREAPAVRSHRD